MTGIRLYLEGKRSDHLAVHLQHLSSVPESLQLSDDPTYEPINEPIERGYFEPVKWSIFSHVCTAPVQYNGARIDDSASIVTKAWFEVKTMGMKKALFLRLGFSAVASARIRRSEWDGPSTSSRKSGFMSMLISTTFTTGMTPVEKPHESGFEFSGLSWGSSFAKNSTKVDAFCGYKGNGAGTGVHTGVLGSHRSEALCGGWEDHHQSEVLVVDHNSRGLFDVRKLNADTHFLPFFNCMLLYMLCPFICKVTFNFSQLLSRCIITYK